MPLHRPTTRGAAWRGVLPLLALALAPGALRAQGAPPRDAVFAHAGLGSQPVLVSGECYRSGTASAAAAGVGYRLRRRGVLFADVGAVASHEVPLANGCVTIGCPMVQIAANVAEEQCGPVYTEHVENPAVALDARAGLEFPLWRARSRSRVRLGVGGGYLAHVGEPYAAWTAAIDARVGPARWSLALDRWHYRLDASETRTRTTYAAPGGAIVAPGETLRLRVAQRTTFVRLGIELPVGRR